MTTKPCTECNGSGWTEETWNIHCYACDGTGISHDEPETPDLCEVCGGTGVNGTEGNPDEDLTDQWNDKPCLTCEGAGYV